MIAGLALVADGKYLYQTVRRIDTVQRDVPSPAALYHQFAHSRRYTAAHTRMTLQQTKRFHDQISGRGRGRGRVRRVRVLFCQKFSQAQQILARSFTEDNPCHTALCRLPGVAPRVLKALGSLTFLPLAREAIFALIHTCTSSNA